MHTTERPTSNPYADLNRLEKATHLANTISVAHARYGTPLSASEWTRSLTTAERDMVVALTPEIAIGAEPSDDCWELTAKLVEQREVVARRFA